MTIVECLNIYSKEAGNAGNQGHNDLHSDKKIPDRSRFFEEILTDFVHFLKKYLRYRKVIYLIGKP